MIGTFTSNVDMKSGAPAFGTPEYVRATQMTGQMARFYGLPLRASNACASNAPDGQAMWESMNSLWSAVQSGVNLVYHAAGWLEGGLIASYEKFVMDCEVLQQFQRYFEPGPHRHLARRARRRRHRRGRAARPLLRRRPHAKPLHHSLLRAVPQRLAQLRGLGRGRRRPTTEQRANRIWKAILAEFEPPPMDEAIRDELADFVARRKREGGAPTDY